MSSEPFSIAHIGPERYRFADVDGIEYALLPIDLFGELMDEIDESRGERSRTFVPVHQQIEKALW